MRCIRVPESLVGNHAPGVYSATLATIRNRELIGIRVLPRKSCAFFLMAQRSTTEFRNFHIFRYIPLAYSNMRVVACESLSPFVNESWEHKRCFRLDCSLVEASAEPELIVIFH